MMKNRKYHIAQFGAFDVKSYGDVLFPKALAAAMKKRLDCTLDLYAKTGKEAMYGSTQPVYAFEEFPARQQQEPYDAVIVGGGELLHFVPIVFSAEQKTAEAGELWLTPIRLANRYHVPVFINCVGVPYDLYPSQQEQLRRAMETVRLISVRDTFSYERLRAAGIPQEKLVCVADQMCDMNRLYDKAELEKVRARLVQEGKPLDRPYIVVQYGTLHECETLAQQLDRIMEKTGMPVYLLAINNCHEDQLAIQRIQEKAKGRCLSLGENLQPTEIMAIIAFAKGFVGTSLHGNLTAASFGVPFVGVDMYPTFVSKMDGLFSMLGCEHALVPGPGGVESALQKSMSDARSLDTVKQHLKNCQDALDAYYDELTEKIQ